MAVEERGKTRRSERQKQEASFAVPQTEEHSIMESSSFPTSTGLRPWDGKRKLFVERDIHRSSRQTS